MLVPVCGSLVIHIVYLSFSLVEIYSPRVRQQPAVRFAVEVALALDSNNFVRFFKMFRLVWKCSSNSLCDYRRTPNGYESVDVDFVFPLQYCTFILQESHLLECMHPASLPYSGKDTRSEVHQQGSQCGQKTDSFPSLFFGQDAGLLG